MTILELLLVGFVASLVSLKVALMAAATILLLRSLSRHSRTPAAVQAPVRARRPRLDEYA
jgi:hypothetical protein